MLLHVGAQDLGDSTVSGCSCLSDAQRLRLQCQIKAKLADVTAQQASERHSGLLLDCKQPTENMHLMASNSYRQRASEQTDCVSERGVSV